MIGKQPARRIQHDLRFTKVSQIIEDDLALNNHLGNIIKK